MTEPLDQPPSLRTMLGDAAAVLCFSRPSAAMARYQSRYLALGLLFTWLAGIGRHWDNPRASGWQVLGLGSVAYVFVLAWILWGLLAPLRPKHWTYRNILLFVCLTSPPALLYAIPVERFMPLEQAAELNVWFLVTVATWRVALLAWFLRKVAGLSGIAVVIAPLFPLSLIVVALTVLNLEHVVFNLMAGLRPEDRSANDDAYFFVASLAGWSVIASPILAVAYGFLTAQARKRVAQEAEAQTGGDATGG